MLHAVSCLQTPDTHLLYTRPKRLNNYQCHRLMVLVSLSVDVVLQIHFNLVVHLCIDIDTAETGNNAYDAKAQTGECNEPANWNVGEKVSLRCSMR